MTRYDGLRSKEDVDAYMTEYEQKMGIGENPDLDADEIPDEGPESKLQGKCIKWLEEHGCLWVHDRSRGKNKPGQPDLLCMLPEGRFVQIELKGKGGRFSKEQQMWQNKSKYLGHEWFECRSYKRFLEIVNA